MIRELDPKIYPNARGGRSVHRRFELLCKCGRKTIQFLNAFKYESVVSCGCYRNAQNKTARLTHGLSKHRVMTIWNNMIARCTRPSCRCWKAYGGRGIKVCKRWLVFQNFVDDMGLPPKGCCIDRKNPNKGYSKRNCRWGSTKDCTYGGRLAISKRIIYQGKETCIRRLAKLTGVPYSTLCHRIRKQGMTPDAAVS